uniref:Uncharacterized protein n=1 Tax=Candidatus Kentrum sp. FW TaxID=2126338 RepID=A0A450U3R1_9GAMM|nr:MAG: hypothetical protein BECKFW1821C_GA0114237_11415 [Candidatus Kentron sp. FW]
MRRKWRWQILLGVQNIPCAGPAGLLEGDMGTLPFGAKKSIVPFYTPARSAARFSIDPPLPPPYPRLRYTCKKTSIRGAAR